jgi:hypothetical protein
MLVAYMQIVDNLQNVKNLALTRMNVTRGANCRSEHPKLRPALNADTRLREDPRPAPETSSANGSPSLDPRTSLSSKDYSTESGRVR